MYSQDTHYTSRLARSEISLVYWMLKRMHSLDSGTFVSFIIWQESGRCSAAKVLTSLLPSLCQGRMGGKSLLEAADMVKLVFPSPFCGSAEFTGT